MPIITPISRDKRRLMQKAIHKTHDKNYARSLTVMRCGTGATVSTHSLEANMGWQKYCGIRRSYLELTTLIDKDWNINRKVFVMSKDHPFGIVRGR